MMTVNDFHSLITRTNPTIFKSNHIKFIPTPFLTYDIPTYCLHEFFLVLFLSVGVRYYAYQGIHKPNFFIRCYWNIWEPVFSLSIRLFAQIQHYSNIYLTRAKGMPHIYLYIINFIDIIGSFTPIIIFIMVHQRDHSIVMPISFRNRIRI